MSDFLEEVTKVMMLELDRKITGKPNGVGDITPTAIVLEQPVFTVSVAGVSEDTLNGLSFDIFYFDEWEDYEEEEY